MSLSSSSPFRTQEMIYSRPAPFLLTLPDIKIYYCIRVVIIKKEINYRAIKETCSASKRNKSFYLRKLRRCVTQSERNLQGARSSNKSRLVWNSKLVPPFFLSQQETQFAVQVPQVRQGCRQPGIALRTGGNASTLMCQLRPSSGG